MYTKLTIPILFILLMLTSSIAGCILDLDRMDNTAYSPNSGSCDGAPIGHSDDGVLRILTYDINAISDEMINQFTNQTGFQVELIRTDDAGGILEQMLQTKDAQQAD